MAPLIRLIVNPNAGGGRALARLPVAEAALRALGAGFTVEHTRSLDHARALARSAAAEDGAVITLGGDGLAGAVAGELRGSRAVLSVLPGGRGNDFLRKLGIPQDVRAACAIALHGRIRAVDVADVDGRAFLGIASAGFDSDVQVIANRTRLPLGGQVYVYGALRAMVSWKPAQWRVTVDGKDRAFPGYSVAVANSGFYGGGMQLAPAARLDDGLLDVVLAGNVSKLRYLRVLPKVFKGTHMPAPKLEVLQGRVIRFQADRPFDVYADGDPIAPMPVTIRVQPGVLRVMAPHA